MPAPARRRTERCAPNQKIYSCPPDVHTGPYPFTRCFWPLGGTCQPNSCRRSKATHTATGAPRTSHPQQLLQASRMNPNTCSAKHTRKSLPQNANDQTLPPRGSARASHTPCIPPHHTLSSQQIQDSLSARCMRRLSPCHPGTLISPHPRSQAATINQNKGGGGGHPPQLSRAPPGGASPREPPPELQGHAPDSAHARTLALPAPSLLLLLLLLRAPPPLPPRASLSAPRPLSRLRRA